MIDRRQAGDTLVEVAIALTILASVLSAAFVVSNRVTRLGISARERTQAINLIQEQAEALKSFRDSRSWTSFQAGIPGGNFHFVPGAGGWVPVVGNVNDASLPSIFLDSTSGRGIYINLTSGAGTDVYNFSITAKWANSGGGEDNQTSVYTRLVNLDGMAPL